LAETAVSRKLLFTFLGLVTILSSLTYLLVFNGNEKNVQGGLAQREVDVLAQRTAGGMEAKMRAGGWPHKAPEGYVIEERQISSNKY